VNVLFLFVTHWYDTRLLKKLFFKSQIYDNIAINMW